MEAAHNDKLHETLSLQLSELEILTSMFVEEKELRIDQDSLIAIQDYVEQGDKGNAINKPTERLTFTLSLTISNGLINNTSREDVLEVTCWLPHSYPRDHPEVYVKGNGLTREIQKDLNDQTVAFLTGLDYGELCVVTLVQWLQENWPEFSERSRHEMKHKEIVRDSIDTGETKNEINLSRLWLYMHHIYNKSKRKHILEWAAEYKLTGFSLPGKPGVVCIEGDVKDTEEYFCRLRQLNWKKITCRHRETKLNKHSFEDFQELVFHVHGSGDDRMSMGEFFQYLVKHDLGEMFKILFGIEGK